MFKLKPIAFFLTCAGLSTLAQAEYSYDPQFTNQWALKNTGQTFCLDDKGYTQVLDALIPTTAQDCKNSNAVVSGTAGIDLNAEAVWDITKGQSQNGQPEIVIGLIDSGVDYNHPEIRHALWKNPAELNGKAGVDDDGNGVIDDIYGVNFKERDSAVRTQYRMVGGHRDANGVLQQLPEGDPMDYWFGHGTNMVAHMVAALNNTDAQGNNTGSAGLAPKVKIVMCAITEHVSMWPKGSAADLAQAALGAGMLQPGYTSEQTTRCLNYFHDLKTKRGVNLVAINIAGGTGGWFRNSDNTPLASTETFVNLAIQVNPRWSIESPTSTKGVAMRDALKRLDSANVLLVAASGNWGWNMEQQADWLYYPAALDLPNVIAVTSHNPNGQLTLAGNYGPFKVDIAAPGTHTLSTSITDSLINRTWGGWSTDYPVNGLQLNSACTGAPYAESCYSKPAHMGQPAGFGHYISSGTSQASAYATAAVGLIKSVHPEYTAAQVKSVLLASGADLPNQSDRERILTGKRMKLAGNGALDCSGKILKKRELPVTALNLTAANSTIPKLIATASAPMDLAVRHTNCATPNGSITVSVKKVSTGAKQTITLTDTGTALSGQDIEKANDGVYTGRWAPTDSAEYELTFPTSLASTDVVKAIANPANTAMVITGTPFGITGWNGSKGTLTFTATVSNSGFAASGLTFKLPSPSTALTFNSVTVTQGSATCSIASNTVTCTKSSLAKNASFTVKVVSTSTQAYRYPFKATLTTTNPNIGAADITQWLGSWSWEL